MKIKNNFWVMSAALVLLSVPLLGQWGAIQVGKKGMITLSATVRVGDAWLPSGSYQIQHIFTENHVMVFKKKGKEVARATCQLQPLQEKAAYNEVHSRPNAAGEKTITEIRIRGENIKHVF